MSLMSELLITGGKMRFPFIGRSDERSSKALEAPLHAAGGWPVNRREHFQLLWVQLFKGYLILPVIGLYRHKI